MDATTEVNPEDKRQSPRASIELPINFHVGPSTTIQVQSKDFSAGGMQLEIISSSDTEAFVKSLGNVSNFKEQNSRFEIQLSARLAWVIEEPGGMFKTGWEFSLQ